MSDNTFTYRATDEAGTARLGETLAELLPAGSLVALDGPLGAGKTRLVQAAAAASGVDRGEVVSPTFVLVHEYAGNRPIIHIDAYRISGDEEFAAMGAEEYFNAANLVFIEWANRVPGSLPVERLQITIKVVAPEVRQFEVSAVGAAYAAVVEQLRNRLGGC